MRTSGEAEHPTPGQAPGLKGREPATGAADEAVERLLAAARAHAARAQPPRARRPAAVRSGRARAGSSRAAWAGLAALALLAVIAGVTVAARRLLDGAGAPHAASVSRPLPAASSTTRPRLPRLPAVEQAAEQAIEEPDDLVGLVPDGWRARCRSAPLVDRRASAVVVCREPGAPGRPSAPDVLELRGYPSSAAADGALGRLGRGVVLGGATARARCAAGASENRAWRRAGRLRVAGRYVCGADRAGARLAWTERSRALVFVIRNRSGRLDVLFAWWLDAPL